MKRRTRYTALAALTALLVLTGTLGGPAFAGGDAGAHGEPLPDHTGADAELSTLRLWATASEQELEGASSTPNSLAEYRRGAICGVDQFGLDPGPNFTGDPCPRNNAPQPPDCAGAQPVAPLWVRTRATPQSDWGAWRLLSGWACPDDLLPPFTQADFRDLPLAKPALTMQPRRGWVLVNKDTIAYSDRATQTFHTALLGHPITVVATPHSYTWDFGDGYRTTTASPGHPYPDQDVAHPYTRLGTRTITLTVTWTATYQYDGYPAVRSVDGTATTTSATEPFTVEERRSHLVAQTCDQNPHAFGC